MEKIPSAEEFFKKYSDLCQFEEYSEHLIDKESFQQAMLEFAKLHVEACKEEVYNNAEVYQHKKVDAYDYPTAEHFSITKNSVLNSYSLENIK